MVNMCGGLCVCYIKACDALHPNTHTTAIDRLKWEHPCYILNSAKENRNVQCNTVFLFLLQSHVACRMIASPVNMSATNPAHRWTPSQCYPECTWFWYGQWENAICSLWWSVGPRPHCFWAGCYPIAPLESTSHTSHNPIHGDKYVQSCSSERLIWFAR